MSISFVEGSFRIRFSGATDIGKVRDHNEDNLLIPEGLPLAAVADGMGGHACGEVASRIAVQTLAEFYRETEAIPAPTWPFRMPQTHVERDRISTAIQLANTQIHETGVHDPSKAGMGCTVDAVFFAQGRYYIGHVGDSRVYRVRGGQMVQLTEDHSLLNDYRRMKEMSGEELDSFPHKNVVVRALGLAAQVFVDVLVDEYQLGDIFLLCTDGLSGMINDELMLQTILRFQSIDTIASTLIAQANDAGGVDNITAVVVRVESA